MDVQQLGPALLSVGDLCREANAAVYGSDAPDVNVHVRANFEEGCFDITFDLIQAMKEISTIIKTSKAVDAKTLLEWLGLIGGGSTTVSGSLWAFLKWKKGRKIESVEKKDDKNGTINYNVTVVGDGNTVQISSPVYKLITSSRVRSAQRGLASPLKQEGIDSVEVREGGKRINELTKEEYKAGAFDILEGEVVGEEPLEPQEFNCVLVIRAPVFSQGAKWQFWMGTQKLSATIGDDSFVRRVFAGGERFGVGDRLHVRLRLTQVLTANGLYRNDYEILTVTRIEQGPKQLTFPEDFGDPQ